MVTCPEGHRSAAADYCDVCGAPIGAPPATVAAPRCPACGAPSGGRFCEACGHDSALPAPSPPEPPARQDDSKVADSAAVRPPTVTWIATVTADRAFYDRVLAREGPDSDRVEFPAYYPPRRITLHGSEILIGKRSVSQGLHPDIDLGIAPADAGVSRAHALLHLTPTGLTVTDLGSTNGTSLNGGDDLIPPEQPVALRSGDRVHVGAWTTITLTVEPA
ncbi:FHA domain-containing protein [Nocardia bhagyanarayanae]|uniref:PSer/pThr/pTyr-binding forkhead associated (FHA) protein n=1 Tax=Nocardia bhagyanarayanae TaxID=1215925 RepID=A0A543FGQ2_9NOCA|nr:FHA domain-containing protein [Nocardia bhagyanarayanae]TQM33040.1 pSer/pThr/pTyr-binding forkhead associated (FHA) protein [Nocardia bhagyanarayanae]